MSCPERHFELVRCPACAGPIEPRTGTLQCRTCDEQLPIVEDIPQFPVTTAEDPLPTVFDTLSPIYETPLWFPTVYRFVGGPFAPLDDREWLKRELDPADKTILDVACGTGRFTRFVAPSATTVWGIDVAEEMLTKAQESATRDGVANVCFARMDAETLHFDSDVFQGVCCGWALHLLPDRQQCVQEMGRVLRPGGTLVGTTIVESPLGSLPGMRPLLRETTGIKPFEPRELRTMLAEAGFEAVRLDRRGFALFFAAEQTDE